MCGIAGILVVEPDRELAARVATMTQTLYHRGPDDGGIVCFGQVSGISAAWQAWGPACFDRFDGMWATAIYEPDARRLILSRDFFGVKPLYYTRTHSSFAFASEIKALLALPEIRRHVNRRTLIDFLCEGW